MGTKCEICGKATPSMMLFSDDLDKQCCSFCFQKRMYRNFKNIIFCNFSIEQFIKSNLLPRFSYVVENIKNK